ncbi:MAG TPA: cupin domain-containing protein [Verrucomicrobiae bacterium]|nr:cupin domain-containing protein [Verrucomicrobiae bacterium]
MASSPHLFHLSQARPQRLAGGAWRRTVHAGCLPILEGLSAELLTLGPHGRHGPFWQANAHTLAYCMEGAARITICSPGQIRDCFTVGPQDVFFIQQGFLQHIESLAEGETKLFLTFSHERPTEMVPEGLAAIADAMEAAASRTGRAGKTNPHRINLGTIEPMLEAGGAFARIASAEEFSILDKLSLRLMLLQAAGAEVPHWHPNCAEIGYVLSGRAQLSVMRPSNKIDQFEVGAGDIYFVPVAFLHSVENIAAGDTELLTGFGHEEPQDILLQAALAPGAL